MYTIRISLLCQNACFAAFTAGRVCRDTRLVQRNMANLRERRVLGEVIEEPADDFADVGAGISAI